VHLAQLLLTLTAVDAAAVALGGRRDQVDPAHWRVGVRERQPVAWHGAGLTGLGDEQCGQVQPQRDPARRHEPGGWGPLVPWRQEPVYRIAIWLGGIAPHRELSPDTQVTGPADPLEALAGSLGLPLDLGQPVQPPLQPCRLEDGTRLWISG
jgi:hypothetical protein